jgi:hypothetical protein
MVRLKIINSAPPVRLVIEPPVKDGLFVQPQMGATNEDRAQRELVEGHNRLGFANNYNYADQWTGNTRTFDPKGNYVCGDCNKADDAACVAVSYTLAPPKPLKINRACGSCRHWEDLCAGDPEIRLTLTNCEAVDTAVYGVAANGQGFGCHRCPFASAAFQKDSRGRELYCGKGDFRTGGSACCQLNGAEVVTEP